MGSSQQFSLRWNNYLRHITSAFDSLRSDLDLVDVTLSCEGKKIKAHKMLLSACSTYFKDLFKENPCQHPVIVFRNVNFADLEALIDFMYQGEVNVVQEQLASFLTTAELLAVQGLTDGTGKDLSECLNNENLVDDMTESEAPSDKKRSSSTNDSYFTPSSQSTASPPLKRKKWSAPTPSASSHKTRSDNVESKRQTQSSSGGDTVDIIPVMPQVKVEMPEFLETESDQINFNSTDPEVNPLEDITGLEHSIPSTSGGSKEESLDMYGGNSIDVADISGEQMTPAELSQVLAKAGPSGEASQDSLQGLAWQYGASGGVGPHFPSYLKQSPSGPPPAGPQDTLGGPTSRAPSAHLLGRRRYPCQYCDKTFAHRISVALHMSCHQGKTVCPICRKVFSRAYNLKLHLNTVHSDYRPPPAPTT